MKDIELPPLPAPFMELHRDIGTTVYDAWATQMQSYARAAVEADRAQRLPDGWKLVPIEPTPKMLVALWEHRERMRGRGENAIAREGYSALLASAPAQPAQQEPDWKDMYEKEKRRSAMWVAKYEKDIGPLEYAVPVAHQEPPQQERKPMTDEQAVKCIEAAGFKTWTSAHFRLVKEAERHHGIKE